MKRIRALDGPTPGLADYLNCEGKHAFWDGFRSYRAGAAYREIFEALSAIQHGLCGYCEIDLTERDRQIEHVTPQSDPQQGRTLSLDPTNMMACCKGGTLNINDEARRQNPVKRNRSCGEAKQDLVDSRFVDPRMLPALPTLMQVRFDGRIAADKPACADAAVDADNVNRTIEILGLNVERLRLAREKRWQALSDNWQNHYNDPQRLQEAARGELLPGEDCCLPRFFTTSRSYFGPLGEAILAEAPQAGYRRTPDARLIEGWLLALT